MRSALPLHPCVSSSLPARLRRLYREPADDRRLFRLRRRGRLVSNGAFSSPVCAQNNRRDPLDCGLQHLVRS